MRQLGDNLDWGDYEISTRCASKGRIAVDFLAVSWRPNGFFRTLRDLGKAKEAMFEQF